MSKKCNVIEITIPMMREKFGEDVTTKATGIAYDEWQRLCLAHADESKAVMKHTRDKIYPTIAMYRGLISTGIDKADAEAFLDYALSKEAEPKAKAMRSMCKLPLFRNMMPSIFKKVTLSTFGAKQGFEMKFYDTPKTRCKFDMTKCLYFDVCTREGCAELTKCFCHTDDVTDGNIHPRLLWNRTKTMGEGGDACDFDLILLDKEKK